MSHHGCSEKAALMLKGMSWKPVDLVNLKDHDPPELTGYDTIIIGGSIHIGNIQGKIRKFCNENEKLLLQKRLGLYLCHMEQGEKAVRQFEDSYSRVLRDNAVAKGLFGGEFNLDKMDCYEKLLVEKSSGVKKTVSRINTGAIEGFGKVIFHLDKS